MSQSKPKANSRKPTLPVGTRVRFLWDDDAHPAVVVAVRRPKFARCYTLALDWWTVRPLNYRRDELEVIG